MSGLSRVLIFCLLLGGIFAAGQAHAQKILEEFKKPLPVWDMMSEAEFFEKTMPHEETPFGDKALSYKVRMPADWKKDESLGLSNYSISSKLLGEVARFYGPPRIEGERSYFSVQAIKLDYQLSAQQWFLQYVLSNGYTLEGIEVRGKDRVEAIYVLIQDGVSYVVRTIAQINGKRVVVAQYHMPVEFWEDEKIMQAQSIGTFELTHPEHDLVEEMSEYHFLDIAVMKHPKSWELRAPPLRSIDRMGVELLNVASRGDDYYGKQMILNGKIEVQLISNFVAESLEVEIENFKNEIEKTGLVLKEVIEEPEDFNFDEGVSFGKVEVYEAADSNNKLLNYELWVTIMSAGDYYYFVTLLTPSRDDDYFVWSRNSQTYKLVTQLIVPQDESLVEN